jgi:serine protease Do
MVRKVKVAALFLKIAAVTGYVITGHVKQISADENLSFDRETPVVRVYQKTHKAVVNISGERLVAVPVEPRFDWPDMFDHWGPIFQEQLPVLGSGVVVHEDGYIITNAHVTKDTEKIRVAFSDGREFPARVVSEDESTDLAVLQITTSEKLPFIRLGRSRDLMIGETMIAIGNPYGYSHTLTTGVVSAVERDIKIEEGFWLRGLIQTDAPINPGNSGGPLLNINGELIGINSAIRAEAENIGFAIPVDALAENLQHMFLPEGMRRVWLGLTVGRVEKRSSTTGLVVESVSKGSPAESKGMSAGCMILEVDGQKLTSVIDFYIKIGKKKIGQQIKIRYMPGGASKNNSRVIDIKLSERPIPDGQRLAKEFFQMEVSELGERVARKFGFARAYPVLIITNAEAQGAAARQGLEAGDLILQINKRTVRNIRELSLEMENVTEGDIIKLRILRITSGIFGEVRRRFVVELKAQSKKEQDVLL